MGKHFNRIMKEMCNRVGADWNNIDPKQDRWYELYEWTEEEQGDFKKWFVDYLYKTEDARKEILTFAVKDKTLIRKAVDWFLLSYGWSFKHDTGMCLR